MVVQQFFCFSTFCESIFLNTAKNHNITKCKAAEEARCKSFTTLGLWMGGDWSATFAPLFCKCQISEAETKGIKKKKSILKNNFAHCQAIHKTHSPIISWTAEQSALHLPGHFDGADNSSARHISNVMHSCRYGLRQQSTWGPVMPLQYLQPPASEPTHKNLIDSYKNEGGKMVPISTPPIIS